MEKTIAKKTKSNTSKKLKSAPVAVNPNGMNEEVFLRIFLRRLADGDLVLAMMEIPDKNGDLAKDILNHASFVHAEEGDVYFDGLRVDFNFLLQAFYFSKPTTLIFFAVNPGGQDER
jgi:glycine cleavage system protein P-like pyridoxal-binding family